MELVRKRWLGSVEPLGILHNAPSKREGFCCHPNHTFHLYEQITQEKLNLALEQGRVKAALPLRAIQESQNKLAKHYRDDGVCRNKNSLVDRSRLWWISHGLYNSFQLEKHTLCIGVKTRFFAGWTTRLQIKIICFYKWQIIL